MSNYPVNQINRQPFNNGSISPWLIDPQLPQSNVPFQHSFLSFPPPNLGTAQHVVNGPTWGNNFHPPSVSPFQVNSQQLSNFNSREQRNSQQFTNFNSTQHINSQQLTNLNSAEHRNSQQFTNFNSVEPRNSQQFTNFNSVEPRNSQQFSNFNSVGQTNSQQFMNCNAVEQRNPDCFVRSGIETPTHFDVSVRSSHLPHYSLNQCNMQQSLNYNAKKFRASEISVSDNDVQSDVLQNFNSAYGTGNNSSDFKSKWNSKPHSNYHLNNFNTDNNYTRNSSVGNYIHQNDSKFNGLKFNSNTITSKFSSNRVNENRPNWKFDKNKTFHNQGNVRKQFHKNGHHVKKNNFEVKQEAKQKYMCDTCDRAFSSETDYQSHVSSHIKCRFPNCQFEAHPAIVTLHKKMQHDTGYADRINKLKNDEEIEKWRAERIRHFPTAANILKRKAEEAEKEARGEVIEEKEFGKFKRQKQDENGTNDKREGAHWKEKKRSRFRKKNDKPRMSSNVPSVSTVSDSESDDDSHIKVRRFSGMFVSSKDVPVDGKSEEISTDAVKNVNHNEKVQEALDTNKTALQCADVKIQNVFTSTEKELEDEAPIEIPIKKKRVVLTSDLQNASEKAASFSDLISNKDAEIKNLAFTSIESNLDNEAPIKMPIIKEERDVHISDSQNASENIESFPNHKSDKDDKTSKKFSKQEQNKTLNRHKNADHNSFRKETLLEKLLADQIRKERNMIMQCVRHVVKNDFFGIGKKR
ncbi:nuclear fragile X mental retardation-interacting protein 1 [Trichonephila inaurata madagascariensis]|uniref:Nuclear fragile X mental retardation-interacting protein 1 n=1 Tax=Trichonephila inaurata madagascariensis TaxID=2747483 RepID=A0A8X6XA55_9ARAC|nr:nuclear fragile X mental retardation-interacting protein 1 [Trichonephila inaurata madagascariensis]